MYFKELFLGIQRCLQKILTRLYNCYWFYIIFLVSLASLLRQLRCKILFGYDYCFGLNVSLYAGYKIAIQKSCLLFSYFSAFPSRMMYRSQHRHRLTFLSIFFALLFLQSSWLPVRILAQQQQDVQKALSAFQAVYIYNITRYVYFPPSKTSGEYIIAVMGGASEISANLEKTALVKKSPTTGQSIKIVLADAVTPALGDYHVLFVPDRLVSRLPQITKVLKGKPTLIITEGSENLGNFPVISMLSKGDKKFMVNNKGIEELSLKVSADFLRYATIFPAQ